MNDATKIERSVPPPIEGIGLPGGLRIVIAGGGTGGHIFPAIAIANALKKIAPATGILFIGANGKMEMEKVPQSGYLIEGLDIAGYNRSSLIKNIFLPFKIVKSFLQVSRIFKRYKPDAVIGVGGYSSFPVLRYAQTKGIPTFIHESNSFAGKSNIMLGKKATKIFTATQNMQQFFPKEKIVVTGNPVRKSIVDGHVSKEEALNFFGLSKDKKTVLSIGGSLGAQSINEAIDKDIQLFEENNLQLIWQTGKPYLAKAKEKVNGREGVFVSDFITQMEYAYAAADIVISRSGAMAIAELCLVKKPVVFVPYPFAAEDHQTANAKELVNRQAAMMISNNLAVQELVPAVIKLSKDESLKSGMENNIGNLAIANADEVIARQIFEQYLMRDIKDISSVYFLGAGGIGMSALARYFNRLGIKVSGYDKTPTVLTKKLEAEGIAIHYEDNISLLDKEASIVVYTPAVPKTHHELNYYVDNNYEVVKRSDVLGMITKSSFNICVAGTHGKTTTSAMVAHILTHSGFGCNAFLGGIASNYETNFLSSDNNVSVAEADEYDRSFLKLSPDVAIITAMDTDHLDIYGTEKNMQDAFIEFSGKIKEGGLLILKKGLQRESEFIAGNKLLYALNDEAADAFVTNIRMDHGSYFFDAHIKEDVVKDVELNMGGMHNIENALASIAVAKQLKIEDEKIKAAVSSFKGVKRRFEYILKTREKVMIDDYAHHPEELRALINGAKALFPGKKTTVIFQPHLFSRTKDLADGFAEVLSLADETILLPIYPARELPMEGVTSELILQKMTNTNKRILEKKALMEWIEKNEVELLITAGAGDIDTLVELIGEIIKNK